MLFFVLTAGLLASTPATPIRLAAPGLGAVNIPDDQARFHSQHLSQQLGLQPDLRCVSAQEVQTLLGFERQKQLLGCSDDAESCAVELAQALGVDGLVTGSLGRLGGRIQVNLKILSARDGRTLAAFSDAARDEGALLDVLSRAARDLGNQLRREAQGPHALQVPVEAVMERYGPHWTVWPVGAIAAAGLAWGGLSYADAARASQQLTGGTSGASTLPLDQAKEVRAGGEQSALQAGIGLGVGAGAAVLTGVLWALTSGERPVSAPHPSLTVVPHTQGAAVVLGGAW